MNHIVECVPNFSEGCNRETIKQLVQVVESVDNATVLDIHMDGDHNRSVITFVADPGGVVEAAVRVVAEAARLIDLRNHAGEHPRLGATDVLPFVPVRNVTMEECIQLAHRAGKRIAQEFGIPVYFYGHAARRPERVRLENVRRGGFERLREEIMNVVERRPDVGASQVHPSAGAIIIGARSFLIAYNVNLNTTDMTVAKRIAQTVRERDGGLPGVKALGLELREQGCVQVSMNLVDYEETGLERAFEAVRREAEKYGVSVGESEIVGLVPQAALPQSTKTLQIKNFSPDVVLEHRIEAAIRQRKAKSQPEED